MEKQFKEKQRYSGEIVYGACSGNGTNTITVLKRHADRITYQFGKINGLTGEAVIETLGNWGEYIAIGEDRFFAFTKEDA